MQKSFKNGKIYEIRRNSYRFMVNDINTLSNSVCAHFSKYTLHTEKKNHFLIFRKVIALLHKKQDLYALENKQLFDSCYKMNFNGKRRRTKIIK